jgi:hypothetical protein
MIRDALSNLGGIGLYGIVSVGIFFATFLGILVWASRLKEPWLKTMGQLPLDPDEPDDHHDPEDHEPSSTPEPKHRHD